MQLKVYMLFVISQFSSIYSAHVYGRITDNVTFFYRKLPVAPSVSSIIEFNVSYSQRFMRDPFMGIHTRYPKINIEKRCSYIEYEQFRNENLHPLLKVGRYKTTTCRISRADTVNCRGRVTVNDYIPRNFSLSFGFPCHWPRIYFLQGLRYNISFSNHNVTSGCVDYSTISGSGLCSKFYNKTSLSNLIGVEHLDDYKNFEQSTLFEALAFAEGTCYQHTWVIACYILVPKCDSLNQVVHPCREMCWDFMEGCWQTLWNLLEKMGPKFQFNDRYNKYFKLLSSRDKLKLVDCDYLPSLHDNISCFHKPVTCDSPPDVTDTSRLLNGTQKDIYHLHDVVQYKCINETFEVIGKGTITCLHSGQWSNSPPKCIDYQRSSVHLLYVVLPVLIMSLVMYINLVLCTCCCKTKPESLTRNRQYDAFVCYCYEGLDSDFAEKIVPAKLEEENVFNLCIHRRDFKAGWDIKWNIMNAIRNSNSAIIIMSQDYINSLWCLEEFEDCYMENMKDPAFKLFVILMQPADTLNVTNEYIKSFFAKKTYLERNDPNLFQKIAKYLAWVKQPKKEKLQPEGVIDDTLNLFSIKNEVEIDDGILMEENMENIELTKLHNQSKFDLDEINSDESVISSDDNDDNNSDDETDCQILTGRDIENNSEHQGIFEWIVRAEVHNHDAGDTSEAI